MEEVLGSGGFRWGAWERVARRFSEDANAKGGDPRLTVEEGELEKALNKAVFHAPEGQLEGPVRTPHGFVIFERQGRTAPSTLRTLDEMEGKIRRDVAEKVKGEFIANFGTEFNERWGSRTYCAADYGVALCTNYEIPLEAGDCVGGGEGGSPKVVPCSMAEFRIVGKSESTDECADEEIEVHTRIGTTANYCADAVRQGNQGGQ